jgi:hypothetical protein
MVRLAVGSAIRAEQPVPEEVDNCEVAVCVQVMDEMQVALSSEPGEACELRSLHMVRLVKVDVSVERCRTHRGHEEKKIERKNEEHNSRDKNGRN